MSTSPDKTPTPAELSALADTLEVELERWRTERASLDTRIVRRERVVADLRAEAESIDQRLFEPEAPRVERDVVVYRNGHGRPRGTADAVVAVLEDRGTPMSASEVYDALERQGWQPNAAKPQNAVRTTLWNLAAQDRIDKLGETRSERRWAAKTSSPEGDRPDGDEDGGDRGVS